MCTMGRYAGYSVPSGSIRLSPARNISGSSASTDGVAAATA